MSGVCKRLPAVIGFLAALQLACPARAQNAAPEHVPLHVGFGRTSFLTVNMADAKAAFKAFTRTVGVKKGYDLDVVVHTFESDDDFKAAVMSNSLHLVIMVAWDYLDANLEDHLEPRFLAIENGQGPREYVLLVKAEAPYQELLDLRGKDVILLENTNCEMSENWLNTLLLEEGLGDAGSFFGRSAMETKPTKTILPVFFGQADACVVNRLVLDMMSELNPQVGRQLRAIAVSEPLVDAVTYIARDGWDQSYHRADLLESLATLHEDPQGEQILTLFKADRLIPFEDGFMTGTRALKEKHDRLVREGSTP